VAVVTALIFIFKSKKVDRAVRKFHGEKIDAEDISSTIRDAETTAESRYKETADELKNLEKDLDGFSKIRKHSSTSGKSG
jgi:hypothetical protein